MQRHMKQFVLGVILLSIHCSFLLSLTVFAKEGTKITERYISNVVELTVKFEGQIPITGMGFIIGEQQDKQLNEELLIVTAKHVVCKTKESPGEYSGDIQVQFSQNIGKSSAEFINCGYSDGNIVDVDLALIKVQKPSKDYQWQTKYFSPPKTGESIWFIGGEMDRSVDPCVIKNFLSGLEITFYLEDCAQVKPGDSGGPLIAEKGIVGMLLKVDQNSKTAKGLSIEAIKQIVVDRWKAPWGLESHRHIPIIPIVTGAGGVLAGAGLGYLVSNEDCQDCNEVKDVDVVGKWNVFINWDDTSPGGTSTWELKENNTFTILEYGAPGNWSLNGKQITLILSTGTIYTGSVDVEENVGITMQGTMVSSLGLTGRWNATRIGQ